MEFIPYGRQWIDEEDIRAVVEVLRGDRITQGPAVEAFEKAVAAYVGTKHAVAFSSGTAALHGAYYSAGVSKGDEIITTPITFAATANAALYLGAKPVFADISPDTWCLDPVKALEKTSSATKAIVPVSYAGYPVDIAAFREIMPDIYIIEDACHALGADRNGQKVGKEADMTVFSFHPVKHITTGEGGMVVTDHDEFAKKLRLFRSHGITKDPELMEREPEGPWYYEMLDLGYNYRLTDIQSVLGLSQMKKLDFFIEERRKRAKTYKEALASVSGITTPPQHPGHAYHLYPILVEAEKRRAIFDYLRENNIGVQVHYLCTHLHPFYRKNLGFKEGDFPVAEDFSSKEISIPIFPSMSAEEQEFVIECLEVSNYNRKTLQC